MIRTFTLLLAATLLMVGLNLSGVTSIPWWVVVIPVAVPSLEWLFVSSLAAAVFCAAPFIALFHRKGADR